MDRLGFVERERTPRSTIQVGIQLHLDGLSLPNTRQALERVGVECSRTAIHTRVQQAELQPNNTASPDQIAVDETAICANGQPHWLFAAVELETNRFLHVRLLQTRTTQLTVLFLRKLREKQQVPEITFLVDGAHHLKAALGRLGLRFRVSHHGNGNSVKRVFGEVKRRTLSF